MIVDTRYPAKGYTNRHLRRHFIKIQNNKCKLCGKFMLERNWGGLSKIPKTAATLDHIIPRGLGGSHSYDNLQVICKKCHIEKGREEGRAANALRDAKREAKKIAKIVRKNRARRYVKT